MKRTLQFLTAIVLLGSLTIQADLVGWFPSETYTTGEPIPANDVQTYMLYCNTTPEEFGPPYEVGMILPELGYIPTITELTFVHNGVAGTYWCAPTQYSTVHDAESGYGPEQNFIVKAQPVRLVPNPPTLSP